MRLLAYLANVAFAIGVVIVAAGAHDLERKGVVFLVLLFLFPVINVVALWRSGTMRTVLSLYLEKKKLEQEREILDLKKGVGEDS